MWAITENIYIAKREKVQDILGNTFKFTDKRKFVFITVETEPLKLDINPKKCRRNDIQYHFFYMEDSDNVDPFVNYQTIKYIINSNKEGITIINCGQAISRSVTIVAAYLMDTFGLNLDDTLAFIRKKRASNASEAQKRDIKPNPGFMKYLYAHEELLKAENRSVRLEL